MEIIKKRKKLKIKWDGIKIVLCISLIIIFLGFMVVSNRLPKFIKNRSKFSINLNCKPLYMDIKTKKYTFYIDNPIKKDLISKNKQKIHNINNSFKEFNNREKLIIKINNILNRIKKSLAYFINYLSNRTVK